MLKIKQTRQFKKSLKKVVKQGKDINKLFAIVELLYQKSELPLALRDHELKGKWKGIRELHIESDWLLAYQVLDNELVLLLIDIGSHAQMLGM
ncbi:type II toxin-antitoxin system YafQ family toxin [Streptococcus mutans]|nr:type II toxin-antitoxin system YafQ family toxin [Streptococcus mutans]